jgi:hypothetical protein
MRALHAVIVKQSYLVAVTIPQELNGWWHKVREDKRLAINGNLRSDVKACAAKVTLVDLDVFPFLAAGAPLPPVPIQVVNKSDSTPPPGPAALLRFSSNDDAFSADALHLSERGYDLLAELVFFALGNFTLSLAPQDAPPGQSKTFAQIEHPDNPCL